MRPKWFKRGQKGAKTVQKVLKGVKRGQNGSKGAKTASEGQRDGQNGVEEGQGREKSHEWSLGPSLSVRKWSLVHPFRERED